MDIPISCLVKFQHSSGSRGWHVRHGLRDRPARRPQELMEKLKMKFCLAATSSKHGRCRPLGALIVMLAIAGTARADAIFVPEPTATAPLGGDRVTGQIVALNGASAQIRLRGGNSVTVDLRDVQAQYRTAALYRAGQFLMIQGRRTGYATMTAASVTRVKAQVASWLPDQP